MKKRYVAKLSWVWIALLGASFTAPPTALAVDLSIVGQWGPVLQFNLQTVHMVLLKTGKVLCIDRGTSGSAPNAYILFDPSDDSFSGPFLTPAPGGFTDHNVFCSGHVPLADGRIVFTGGGLFMDLKTTVFDPEGGTGDEGSWELQDDSPARRFYPTFTRQADGTLMAVAGGNNSDDTRTPTVFDITKPAGSQWTQLPGAQYCDPQLGCGENNFYIHWYPLMYYLSNGLLFYAGEDASETELISRTLNPGLEKWETLFQEPDDIAGGSAVMYRPDSIIKAGGLERELPVISAQAWRIDAASATPTWSALPDMNHARREFYLIVLPDGRVLAIGGGKGFFGQEPLPDPVFTPELFDPDNPSAGWSDMALASVNHPREYHSSAVLLPDARVLIAGGTDCSGSCTPPEICSGQVFTPPYLFAPPGTTFDHPRPVIESVSPISYRTPFTVQSNIASDIVAVSLIGTGAATHSFDHNQRFMNLSFAYKTGNTIKVAAPANSDQAPPGYYMLFLIDDHGRPSVAEIVQIS